MARDSERSGGRDSVVLLHSVPGAGVHAEWMIAPAEPATADERVLMTWRLDEPIGRLLAESPEALGEFDAVRIVDHRFRYLTYEGEVSGGRGTVRRIAEGAVRMAEEGSHRVVLNVEFTGRVVLEGDRVGDAPLASDAGDPPLGLWRFRVLTDDGQGG